MAILRKSTAHLTDAEWLAFCNALLAMKAAGVYNDFIAIHALAARTNGVIQPVPGNELFEGQRRPNAAHRGPAFLPWHRAMLWEFEAQLQLYIDPSYRGLGIPYWDWTRDPTGASVFNQYLGTTINDPLADGMFTLPDWPCVQLAARTGSGRDFNPLGPIERVRGMLPGTFMPDMTTTVPAVMDLPVYDSYEKPTYDGSFRRNIEDQLHDPIHRWIGGPMGQVSVAPNDPIFYLHHANIDRLWLRWQEMHPSVSYIQDPNIIMPEGQNYTDTLVELNETVEQVWDYTTLGYSYERPDTVRRLAGVGYYTYATQVGAHSPISIEFPIDAAPASAYAVQAALTGWDVWFDDEDREFKELVVDCTEPNYTGPVPEAVTGEITLRDEELSRAISVKPQACFLFLTDPATFGALLVGYEVISVSVLGKKSPFTWDAPLTPTAGAEFAAAFISSVEWEYSDSSHHIRGEEVYIDAMPTDSVPTQVTGSIGLWDYSGHDKINIKLTVQVLYFSTQVLPSNLNYVLSGVIDNTTTTGISKDAQTLTVNLNVPDATALTIPVMVGVGWSYDDGDHNLRGNRAELTSDLYQLTYQGHLWDNGKDDDWQGDFHALVLCFAPYWL